MAARLAPARCSICKWHGDVMHDGRYAMTHKTCLRWRPNLKHGWPLVRDDHSCSEFAEQSKLLAELRGGD
jgi:hypothetical protein